MGFARQDSLPREDLHKGEGRSKMGETGAGEGRKGGKDAKEGEKETWLKW